MNNGKKRILVVDDEPGFTRLLKLNLEQTDDYEVAAIGNPSLGRSVHRLSSLSP